MQRITTNPSFLIMLLSLLIVQIVQIESSGGGSSGHVKSNHVPHKDGCLKFDPKLNSITLKRQFISVQRNIVSSINSYKIYDKYKEQCSSQVENLTLSSENAQFNEFSSKLTELSWTFQFIDSLKCIRVELDLGNISSNFKKNFDYDYYMFSYREFAKENIYFKRHPIKDSINSLIINKVNLTKPYIVCVTFYTRKIAEINIDNKTMYF
jgi:hypothetical protein